MLISVCLNSCSWNRALLSSRIVRSLHLQDDGGRGWADSADAGHHSTTDASAKRPSALQDQWRVLVGHEGGFVRLASHALSWALHYANDIYGKLGDGSDHLQGENHCLIWCKEARSWDQGRFDIKEFETANLSCHLHATSKSGSPDLLKVCRGLSPLLTVIVMVRLNGLALGQCSEC